MGSLGEDFDTKHTHGEGGHPGVPYAGLPLGSLMVGYNQKAMTEGLVCNDHPDTETKEGERGGRGKVASRTHHVPFPSSDPRKIMRN